MRKFDYDEIVEPDGHKSISAKKVSRSARELAERFEYIDSTIEKFK